MEFLQVPVCIKCKVYAVHSSGIPLFVVDTLFSFSFLVDLLQPKEQQRLSLVFSSRVWEKSQDDNESTSREEKIEADKLSVLPSLPENVMSQDPQNPVNTPVELLWAFQRRAFDVLIKDKCYYLR